MKEGSCRNASTAMRQKKRQEKAIEDGDFGGALGYKITVVTVEVEVIFKPSCIIRRPKQKKS